MVHVRKVFLALAIAALPMIAGCSSSSTSPNPTPAPQTLYVGNFTSTAITEYSTTASGNIAPTLTIT